jgi:DNA gyrase/topoisomerase IV subunit B
MSCIIRVGHIHFKKFTRHKDVKKITKIVNENAVKGTIVSFVPSELTDLVIHHSQINLNQVIQTASDVASTCVISTLFSIVYILIKSMYD